MDLLKKLKGAISDDDIKRYTKEVDTKMEKNIEKITKTLKDKESELLQ
jgi:ribosome recycling factor